MTVQISPDVNSAWQRLTQDSSPISWIMCGYPDGAFTKMELIGEGTGGMPELISQLPPDQLIWAAFKVVGVDNRGNTVSRRPKFIFLQYFPEQVPAMKRGRAGGHKGAIKQILDAHIDVAIENPSELTEDMIVQKLRAAGGAHQPTGYEFSDYSS